MEPNARNTIQNFRFSLLLIKEMGIDKLKSLFIVTSDYHVPRCLYILNTINLRHSINKSDRDYFIKIDKIYPVFTVTNWTDGNEMQRRYKNEEYLIYNSTKYRDSVCREKWYLFQGNRVGKADMDLVFNEHCDVMNRQ